MDGLLNGVRVLDFTDFLAGPYCGMFLADMGAEVIKVENLASKGNFVRGANPKEKKTGRSMYFQNLNRNKKGVALNLKTDEGKELFAELIKSADVLIENMRPGVLTKLGFSYEACKEINPGIIYTSISGFGQYGPYSTRPGYDLIAQAMGGSMSVTGWPGMEPTRAGLAVGDMFAGLNAAIGILASLYKKKETGLGNQIDVALVDSIVSAMENKIMSYIYDGKVPEKTGNKYVTSAPYDSFKAKDTHFVIASGTDAHFVTLSAALGMPELAENPKFHDTPARNRNSAELKEIIEKWACDKTAMACVEIIDNAGIPAAPIYDAKDVVEDKNISEVREMLVTVPHPEAGDLTVLGNPIKMSNHPCKYEKAAPDLGEDNEVIFTALGISKEKYERYKSIGAVN